MGDRQLSPIDLNGLGKSVSFYSSDQPQLNKGRIAEDDARMFASSSGEEPDPSKQLLSRSSSFSSTADLLRMDSIPLTTKTERRLSSSEGLHLVDNGDAQNDGELLLKCLQRTVCHDNGANNVEIDLNSVITSLGLMQVRGGVACTNNTPSTTVGIGLSPTERQCLGVGLPNALNLQSLSPAVCRLLAQSNLVAQRRPITGHHFQQQQQQSIANSQQLYHASHQNNFLLNNLQTWNGNLQASRTTVASPSCNDSFNTPWGPNQQNYRIAQYLSNNVIDSPQALLSKLHPKTLFPTRYQMQSMVRPTKMISNDNADGTQNMQSLHHVQEQSNQDFATDQLNLSCVDSGLADIACLSQDHMKGGHNNWILSGCKSLQKEVLSPFGLLENAHLLDNNGCLDQVVPQISPNALSSLRMEHYSRKVFVGGLPPDIDEEEITTAFRRFGPLVVDWPHKAESKSYFPPKGYCFLLFQEEFSVQTLMETCMSEDGKLFWVVSSPTMKDKMVQIRPWNLGDSDFVMDGSQPLDPRKTIFVGGVPRPLRAIELAVIMERLYGGVCYAGIDTDPELKYPKGAGRVAFSSQQSYIAAISARFVQLQHGDIDKRVEVKPYVLDDQLCDECQGVHCAGRFAQFFCANVTCLQYYCEHCWSQIHSRAGREFHKPLVKEGADRPRSLPFRWC